MSVEEKAQIKMRASVGTLRAHAVYWIEPDRAARLVDGGHAAYVTAPEPVSIIDAIETVAAEMRAGHRMHTDDPEPVKEVQEDGAKGDESKGAPRARRRAGNGNGGGDPAGRLDKSADGKQG